MALTFEQFKELRSKGLTVEQIASFEKGYIPETTQTINQPTKNKSLLDKVSDFGLQITGAKAGSKLLQPIFSGLTALNPFTPKSLKEKVLLGKPDELTSKMETEGLKSVVKDVAGSSIELATSLTPYASGGASVGLKSFSSVAKQFPTIARYAGYGARGASYGGSFALGQSLQQDKDLKGIIEDTKKGATIGALTGVAIPMAVEGTVRAVKNISTLYSGVPKDAIENAFRNPEKVKNAIKQYSKDPENTRTILTKAEKSLQEIKKLRQKNYQANLEELNASVRITKTGKNKGTLYIKNEDGIFIPTKLTTKGLKDNITSTLKSFNIIKTKTGFDFSKAPIPQSEQKNINELIDRIYNYDDYTPKGLDNLSQIINSYRKGTNSTRYNAIITSLNKQFNNYLSDRVPQIGVLRSQYAKDSEFINVLQREIFGKNKNISDETKLNRLISIFNKNNDIKKRVVEKLGDMTDTDLLNEINGAILTRWLPENFVQRFVLATGGLAVGGGLLGGVPGAGVAITGAGLLGSPKLSGLTATQLGILNRAVPYVKQYGLPALLNSYINKQK